jgi:hypothetical protein
MKQTLLNAEELTVKYALNELDPTEARLLEAAMNDDQDLLIEAESQRRTWARVRSLPLMNAPAGLLDDTVRMAVAAHRKPKVRILPFSPAWRWAAAASILVIASIPFLRDTDPALVPAAATADVTTEAPDTRQPTEPWVDNQDVIRLQDTANATATTDSAGQLVPIDPNNPSANGVAPRQLQLTGSKRTP